MSVRHVDNNIDAKMRKTKKGAEKNGKNEEVGGATYATDNYIILRCAGVCGRGTTDNHGG